MFEVGQKVRITEGIYEGRVVEVSRVVAQKWDHPTLKWNGYAVKGLSGTGSEMSTFWDDGLEKV